MRWGWGGGGVMCVQCLKRWLQIGTAAPSGIVAKAHLLKIFLPGMPAEHKSGSQNAPWTMTAHWSTFYANPYFFNQNNGKCQHLKVSNATTIEEASGQVEASMSS